LKFFSSADFIKKHFEKISTADLIEKNFHGKKFEKISMEKI
jgi:hypothetical protein